jgi:hypothetical protein
VGVSFPKRVDEVPALDRGKVLLVSLQPASNIAAQTHSACEAEIEIFIGFQLSLFRSVLQLRNGLHARCVAPSEVSSAIAA